MPAPLLTLLLLLAPAAPLRLPVDELPDGVIALLDGEAITDADFRLYIGRVHARQPAGDEAVRQLLMEAIVRHAAVAARVTAGEEEAQAILDDLEARARAATGGEVGLEDSLGPGRSFDELKDSVRLLALQHAVMRAETGAPPGTPVSDADVAAWLAERVAAAELTWDPLDSRTAARWAHGRLGRLELGMRLERMLDEEELSGLLSELIGIRLIQRRADELGFTYTHESGAREITEREQLLTGRPPVPGTKIEYEQIVEQTQRRTIEELMASPKFMAEVLLRDMVEARWTEEQLRDLFERERATFTERYGEDATYETIEHAVWREVRQRTYQRLFKESTIVRRY